MLPDLIIVERNAGLMYFFRRGFIRALKSTDEGRSR